MFCSCSREQNWKKVLFEHFDKVNQSPKNCDLRILNSRDTIVHEQMNDIHSESTHVS